MFNWDFVSLCVCVVCLRVLSMKEIFLLTKNGPPVRVETFIPTDDEEGAPEHKMNRNTQQNDEVRKTDTLLHSFFFSFFLC